MIDEFRLYVEETPTIQFKNSIQDLHKSVDKVTRHLSQIKSQGNWFVKKKKKIEKEYT